MILEIPWQDLDEETLHRLLGEIVTRDGTDYGAVERSTASKIATALKQLQSGSAKLMWDAETETAALLSSEQLRSDQARERKLAEQAGMSPDTDSAGE